LAALRGRRRGIDSEAGQSVIRLIFIGAVIAIVLCVIAAVLIDVQALLEQPVGPIGG